MGSVGRIILIVVVVVLVIAGAGYFLGPQTASRAQTLEVARPAPTVLARLASTPVGASVVEGVTIAEPATVDGDTVSAPVTFADGATGRVVYTVTPSGEGSNVQVRLEQNLGANPMDRLQAFTGGDVGPLIATAATSVQADLDSLPNASFEGLQYSVQQVEARPFFYAENCQDTSPETITALLSEAATVIPNSMRTYRLTATGPLTAVEPRVVAGRYCFQIGYPFSGRAPSSRGLYAKVGQTPGGTVLRVVYTGAEASVMDDVYNPMDALLAAAHLDDPATPDDDWTTYEVYHDDPTQEGGSRNREIFYVVQGDISALTRVAPPTAAVPVPGPAQPADATAPATPPAETPATTPPATTPAPATTP